MQPQKFSLQVKEPQWIKQLPVIQLVTLLDLS